MGIRGVEFMVHGCGGKIFRQPGMGLPSFVTCGPGGRVVLAARPTRVQPGAPGAKPAV
jgi:hypothetical protein